MDHITANEVAGLGVGALLLCATLAAPKVDAFISSSQRSLAANIPQSFSLYGGIDVGHEEGMCKRCGDLRLIACSTCKGTGLVRSSEPLSFGFINDLYQSFGAASSNANGIPCTKCRSKGCFRCPDCSRTSAS